MKWIIIIIVFGIVGGIVAFNFMEGAKSEFVNNTYNQTVKYTKDEIKKCNSGESKYMDGLQKCPPTIEKTIAGIFEVFKDQYNLFTFNENNLPDRGSKILRKSKSNTQDTDLGFINLSTSGENIILNVCFKKPCSNEINRRSDTIEIK